jgi:hypothetical protein
LNHNAVLQVPTSLSRQIPQQSLQDAAVLEVVKLIERINAARNRDVLFRAVTLGRLRFIPAPGIMRGGDGTQIFSISSLFPPALPEG